MALLNFRSWAVPVVWTLAGWVGESIVDKLVGMAYSSVFERMPANTEAELKRIQAALPQITAVMGIAEALKMKDPSAGLWVEQLRQALEASEDVLDELEYKRLEDMVKNQDEASGSNSSSKKRKLSALDNDTLERFQKAVTMLDQAANGVERLLQAATVLGIGDLSKSQQQVLRCETTSLLAERKVFGRDSEKDKIIRWLKRECNNVGSNLSSFGIVGVGGVGKTTLVQFACQEILKENQFEKTIWVCVSTNFSVKDITRKMLSELGINSCGKPLNALQDALKKKIDSKKVLLVLDDVWDDERRGDWEQLIAPFRLVNKGSKILFTTRMKSVANLLSNVISKEHESLALQGLREQELQLLFNSYAFDGFDPDNYKDLLPIGNQIVKMLLDSPLVAKVIGSLLNSRMDRQYWRRILNHGSIFKLEQGKNVVEVLKLSYYHLSADLQVCFRFCSIFRQDHLFDKNDLIKMWIASGFIRQQVHQEERLEDIGEDYFNCLLRKSFFEYSISWEGEKYVMHDLMHELARNVSTGECCRVESTEIPVTIPSTVRHVYVHESEIDRVSHLGNLRSLVIFNNMNLFVLPNNIIKKPLRLLKIEGCGISELPKETSCLIHLRYLSFGQIYVSLPFNYSVLASIYKLYHLQVLEISIAVNNSSYSGFETTGMTNLLRLRCLRFLKDKIQTTRGITNLFRLRYMRLPEEIMQTIRGVHKLTSLQELNFFVGQESGNRINELGTLNNLRNLSIKRIENIEDHAEAKSANLSLKNNLMSLSLEWTSKSRPDNHEEIIDCLQPPPNLMELTIENYLGQKSPNWMEQSPLLNLSSLKLFNCHVWKNLLFSRQMSYLEFLDICDCPNLEKLPNMPISLIKFGIDKVGLTSLPDLYQSFGNNTSTPLSLKSSLRVVEIKGCPKLISLDGFLQQGNLDLLETLTIQDCEGLEHLPTHGFGNLTSLVDLTLTNSPKLSEMNFQGYILLKKLQRLNMGNCGELDKPLLEASSRLTTLTELQISKCTNITSITASHNSFRSLKSLNIQGCTILAEISFQEEPHGINRENNFNVLKMVIMDCPNLTKLLIKNMAVSTLPQYYQSSDSNGGTSTLSLISSLRDVEIRNCPTLTELNGFLQQDNINFQSIEKIEVSYCRNLKHLPVGAFEKFVSLKELTIRKCAMLVAIDNQSNLLPTKLEKLSIENCGELDVPLLESASTLVTLTHLSIINCENISHIPSSENAFGSLYSLSINGCDKLLEHSSRIQAQDVNQGSNLASLKLSHLDIDHLSLLLIEPLRSLKSVSKLIVSNCSPMWALPEQWLLQNSSTLSCLTILNASTLQLLPATMVRLTALEWLEIWKGNLLEELPELPASLKEKYIQCRQFTSQFGISTRNYPPFAQSSNHWEA